MEHNSDGLISLSREELYQKVWATPVRTLAKEYGLSDVGLAKICKKHKIPKPSLGYWMKKQHGKKVRKTPLPTLQDSNLENIKIRRKLAEDFESKRPEIREAIFAESLPDNVIEVPDDLVDPLPVVEKTAESLQAARVDDWGRVKPRAKSALCVSVAPDSIDRTMRILDALLKAMNGRSWNVQTKGDQGIAVDMHGEEVEFTLTEEANREERELTPHEKRKIEQYPWYERDLKYRYVPSGRLCLEILTYGGGQIRRRWRDGKKQRIENVLNSFMISMLKISDAVHAKRLEEEEDRRQREEWERVRGEKLRLIREEEKRLDHLNAEVDAWDRSQRIRSYISAVRDTLMAKHGQIEEGSPAATWLEWANQQADRADPLVESPKSILDEKSQWARSFY